MKIIKTEINNSTFKTRSASALIITLLVIGLISSFALFISRGTIRESRLVDANEASLGAYYAAEAGLEDGLARLAADKNIEVPTCAWNVFHGGDSTNISPCDTGDNPGFNQNLNMGDLNSASPQSFPTRVRMARFGALAAFTNNSTDADLNAVVDPNDNVNDPTTHPNEYYYDLKITSRTNIFGKADPSGSPANTAGDPTGLSSAYVKQDGILNFMVDTSGTNQPTAMDYFWVCDTNGDGQPEACTDSQILVISLGHLDGTTDDLPLPGGSNPGTTKIRQTLNPLSVNQVNKIGIKFLGSGGWISVAFINNSSTVLFKGTVARLQSIGYFGGVKRRLEANIDRNSGGVLGLFDYTVYAGGGFNQ